MKKALIFLGCPEAPSQTPLALYTTYKLSNLDYDVTITANPAATKLLKISDPGNNYVTNIIDLERCLDSINSEDYDLFIGFIHNDAAASYFVTFYQILQTKSLGIIFEKDGKLVEDFNNIVKDATDAETIAVRAYHNPNPIKVQLDKILKDI